MLKQPAPYDAQNALDFREMTKRIAGALEAIERDPSIPATQKELAKRAGCSRVTLWNRGWPIERLDSIKVKRKESSRPKPKRITLEHRKSVEVHIEDKEKLLEQLRKSRTEAAVWFDKFQEERDAKNRLRRNNDLLLGENEKLKQRNSELISRVSELEAASKKGRKKIVLPFGKRSRSSGKQGSVDGKKDNTSA
jgi:hypothetical protein